MLDDVSALPPAGMQLAVEQLAELSLALYRVPVHWHETMESERMTAL